MSCVTSNRQKIQLSNKIVANKKFKRNRRKRIKVMMLIRKRKNCAAVTIQCKVRFNIAVAKVMKARDDRLLFLTDLMESEYAFNDIRQLRCNRFDEKNKQVDEERISALDYNSRKPNKWMKILTDSSPPPKGCFFGNVTHTKEVIEKAGIPHFVMKFSKGAK